MYAFCVKKGQNFFGLFHRFYIQISEEEPNFFSKSVSNGHTVNRTSNPNLSLIQ